MEEYIKEEKSIGEGSYGTVYRAFRPQTNETFAMKIIPITKGPKEKNQDLSSLLQECQLQRKLKHPNIIQMIQYFTTNNPSSLVIVSELADCSLFDLLQKEERLELGVVEKYAREITAALHYIHSKCIIHRDLKPQNVLIGKAGQAQLCDFGFARNLSNDKFLLTSVKGTPLYMSPELVKMRPYDERTDLWSFGCILYELLVGSPPYPTDSIWELCRKIINEPVFYPDYIHGNCRSFLQGLLEKDQGKRLGWPHLIHHPFVAGCVDETSISHELNSLTITRSPSQELAKEMDMQTMMKMRKINLHLRAKAKYQGLGSRTHNLALGYGYGYNKHNYNLLPFNPRNQIHQQIAPLKPRKIDQQDQISTKNAFSERREPKVNITDEDTEEGSGSGSSCETLSSSSNSNSCSEDEENEVVEACSNPNIQTGVKPKPKSLELCDSGVFSRIEAQNPIESEEWVHFLKRTMKEIVECPSVLCDKHFLNVIITPLRNPHSSSEVVENIAVLLTLPFPLDPKLYPPMLELYLEGKVVPNLVSACLLIVQRRKLEENSKSFKNLETLLKDEEIVALERCLELISFLMLWDEKFIVPFCDSIGILSAYSLLELFIRCWGRRKALAIYTLNFLTIVLDKDPRKSFVEIVETLFLDESNGTGAVDLWELIGNTETDPEVRSKALRLLGLLLLRSTSSRAQFMSVSSDNGTRLWNLIESLKSNESDKIKKAATFAGRLTSYIGYPPQTPPVLPSV